MKYITNSVAIILVLSTGKTLRVEKTDPKYPLILNTFSLPEEEQEQEIQNILDRECESKPTIKTLAKKGFDVDLENSTVTYQGEKLPKSLVTKVLSITRDGLPIVHFERFWENLRSNPSAGAVDELTDFLSYKELPLTEDGCFLAYKGVNEDFWSVYGNTETTVLQGKVDSQGRILNSVGSTIEVLRRDVDDDRNNECSHGLHAGSRDYAVGHGPKAVVVKINPADVVSVPRDCSFQKCRVCKYEVVDFYTQEITASVVDAQGKDTLRDGDEFDESWDDEVEEMSDERMKFIDRVESYILSKGRDVTEVSIRQIQSSFSPFWPSKEQVLDALQYLGEDFDNTTVYL